MDNESLVRITKAGWLREYRMERFIYKYLIRNRVPLFGNVCPYIKNPHVNAVIKDFKRVGTGGVGLVWGCFLCNNAASGFMQYIPGLVPKVPFSGTCRTNNVPGDVNKIIIIPKLIANGIPTMIGCNDEVLQLGSGKTLKRRVLRVVSNKS
jgi:hypothetical protein